jgi:6-phosphogluconolactonase (cycloisomerase 2 family)
MKFSTNTDRRAPKRRVWLALSGLLMATTFVQAASAADGPANVVYVERNSPEGNSIFAFRRDAQGALRPISGSPFATGGLGSAPSLALGPFDSDHEILVTPGKNFLLAVNSGGATVSVFKITAEGTLQAVHGSPFPSGGANPVSLCLTGDIVTVVNKADDPPPGLTGTAADYATFRLTADGGLVPTGHAVTAPGTSPTDATLSPAGYIEFGAQFPSDGLLRSFLVLPGGSIIPSASVTPPVETIAGSLVQPLPLGLAAHPYLPILYVGFVNTNRLGVYVYDAIGGLHFVRTVPNSGTALCWVRVNKAATRLYTSNTITNSISVYDLSDPIRPVEIQDLTLHGGNNSYQITLDPTEQYFYVVGQVAVPDVTTAGNNVLHTLAVNRDGTLTEVPSSPTVLSVPEGTRSQGVVAL